MDIYDWRNHHWIRLRDVPNPPRLNESVARGFVTGLLGGYYSPGEPFNPFKWRREKFEEWVRAWRMDRISRGENHTWIEGGWVKEWGEKLKQPTPA